MLPFLSNRSATLRLETEPEERHRLCVVGLGTSAVFSVPENFGSSGLRISTEFSYAWESPTHGPDDISVVVHYVRYGVYPLEPSSKVIDPKTGDLHFSIPVAVTANAKR